jgi:hypothetical protein
MAITVTNQITNQDVSSTGSYCYLFEPLKANIIEDAGASEIYIDMAVYDSDQDDVQLYYLSEYVKYDYAAGITLEVDFTKIIQQYHDSNVFKLGTTSDIVGSTDIPVSKYRYIFYTYSDVTTLASAVETFVTPIIGGRNFYDFTPAVGQTQALTEAALNGVDLTGRWLNYPNISITLGNPTSTNAITPTITVTTESTAELEPCGGMLIWKSRFGGWMYWGMDIAQRNSNSSYEGNLQVGMFEANDNGNPYIQADYTGVTSSYSINLKAIALTNDELESVVGIADSVAVYYMRNSTAKLELMRVSSSSAPISTLIGGGDFSVSLSSISTSSQKAR